MWIFSIILFLVTVAAFAHIGTKAQIRFVTAIRDHHPDLYEYFKRPTPGVNKSLIGGIRMQKVMYSRTPLSSEEGEAARLHYRRITTMVFVILPLELAFAVLTLARAGIS